MTRDTLCEYHRALRDAQAFYDGQTDDLRTRIVQDFYHYELAGGTADWATWLARYRYDYAD